MKALVGRAVKQAFNALKDMVEVAEVTKASDGYDWAAGATGGGDKFTCRAVTVEEVLNNGQKKVYAILEFPENPPAFSVLKIGARKFKCSAPLSSYKFIVMTEIYEIL